MLGGRTNFKCPAEEIAAKTVDEVREKMYSKVFWFDLFC
jgi:hypothetical protein